jgi:glycosyltransferase involved in cell wall biosynthesis
MQFKLFHNNTDRIIVQSLVMKDLLLEMRVSKSTVKVLPFKNAESLSVETVEKIENSFLYVASGEHHKNHINLIDAWAILAEENIRPTLFLTIDKSMPVYHKIIKYLKSHNLNIIFLENIPREELLIYYKKVSALIYPSLFESYGLPLLEAKNYGLPILASELDYVRDLLDPEQSFDPLSPRSISRAVKRFLNINERSYNVMTGDAFIKEISAWI